MIQSTISIYSVTSKGAISLVAANLPYSCLQWNRRFSTCGDFAAELIGPFPVAWPGRYLLTRSDRPEVGVVEKVEARDGAGGVECSVSGRFAESLLDRRQFGPAGGEEKGGNWRQAVSAAVASWMMPDAPEVRAGAGTEARSGSSYAVRADKSESAMEAVYGVTAANGAYPALALDWAAGALVLSIMTGVDRTRAQSARPVMVFSLEMATAAAASYCGDFSVGCSSVVAYAEPQGGPAVSATVAVPGFDAETMWMSEVSEDVSSLCSQAPTEAEAERAGGLRAYDHRPAVDIDMDALGAGYAEMWDLGDLCEACVPSAGVTAAARIEEVREVVKKEGATLEVVLGTKKISKTARAMMRLR